MASGAEKVVVRFEGAGSGTGELSWGQKENWSAIIAQNTWIPLGGVAALPAGTTIDDIAGNVRYMFSRYQPMRTLLTFDAGGVPNQTVHESGEYTIEVVDARDRDPGEVAEALAERYRAAELDFANEWPARIALIRKDGSLTHLIVLISHFVTDAAGAAVMLEETGTRDTTPIGGMQPLAQAQWQLSPAGIRQNERAQHYWESILRAIAPRRYPDPGEPDSPRYRQAEFRSTALWYAIRAISDRTGTETSPVLLAVFAAALTRVTGINPVVVRPMVSNRFRPGLARVVCTLAQAGLISLDVAGVTVDEAVGRVERSAMAAYKYAYFDLQPMRDVVAKVSAERGEDIDIACYFNDRRVASRPSADDPVPTPELIADALGGTAFRWVTAQDAPSFEPLFVHIDDVPGTQQVSLYLDTAYISSAAAEAVAHGMEEIAVAAAF